MDTLVVDPVPEPSILLEFVKEGYLANRVFVSLHKHHRK